MREDLRLLAAAAASVNAAGLVRPYNPRILWRAGRIFRQYGPTPATLFAITAGILPTKAAVIDDDGTLTYAEVQHQSEQLAAGLHSMADGGTGSVAVLCRNGRSFLIALLAGAQLGRELVFLNTEFTATQLAQVLARHQPAVLVHDAEYTDAVADSGTTALTVVAGSDTATWARCTAPQSMPRVHRPVKLTILTSGTTGLAKGVSRAISRRALVELAISTMATVRLGPEDVMAISPPFFHGFGILSLVGATAVGATTVCHRHFDAARAVTDIGEYGVTIQAGVPVMLQRMTDYVATVGAELGPTTLRLTITGGAKITASTVERFHAAFGPTLVNGYGSTEAGLISLATTNDLARDPSSLGRPILGVSVRILRDDRTAASGTEVGTIFVSGGLGFGGYVRAPGTPARGESKEVVDGFVNSGDRGYFDVSGQLHVIDRDDDMIVSGGENIFPGEVESALTMHPHVHECAVLGVPDVEYGQVLHAVVVLNEGAPEVSTDSLKAHLRERLERYKQPKVYTFTSSIPRNAMGKVLKAALIDRVSDPDPMTLLQKEVQQ